MGITLKGTMCKKIKCYESDFCKVHGNIHQCGICLDTIKNMYKLHCGHSFCASCIFKWICKDENSNSCPMCRTIVSESDFRVSIFWCVNNGILKEINHWKIPIHFLDHESQEELLNILNMEKFTYYTEVYKLRELFDENENLRIIIKGLVKEKVYVKIDVNTSGYFSFF
jgi:hypothetical protein